MATYKRCDRCKQSTEDYNYLEIRTVTIQHTDEDRDKENLYINVEICISCVRELKQFIRSKENK